MDEGWTRLVLEKYGFKYTTLHPADICAGSLKERVDVLLIPSIEPKTLRDGFAENETEPAYVGGLGSDGADALREFLKAGGTLVCLADSTDYAIEELSLPVKNVLKGLKTSVFYAPGSILRAVVTEPSSWTAGVPGELSVYFDRSQAFEIEESARKTGKASVILSYAKEKPLESGWLLGPEKIEGKAALVEVRSLGGHVLLFGFRPQHRGQPHGTFRLLFNALLRVGSAPGFLRKRPRAQAIDQRSTSPLDVKHLRRGQAVAEGLEVLEGPDDLLVAGHLEELGVVGPGVAVAHDEIAVRQELQGGDPEQPDPRQLVVTDLPDHLAFGRDLDHAISTAGGDQRVAAGEPDRPEDLGPVPLVARGAGPAVEVEGVAPDHLAGRVVLADHAVSLVADQVVAVGQFPCHAGVAVRRLAYPPSTAPHARSSPRGRPR